MFCAECGRPVDETDLVCGWCGNRLRPGEPQAAGTPPGLPAAGAVLPAPDTAPTAAPVSSPSPRRALRWVVALVAVAGVGVAAFFLTQLLLGGDEGAATTIQTSATTTGAGSDTTSGAAACDLLAQEAADEAVALAQEWDGYSAADLAVLARTDPAGLPGFRALTLAAGSAAEDATAAGCDPDDLESAFDEALTAADPAGAGRVVIAALYDQAWGFGGEASGDWGLPAALVSYPIPEPPPEGLGTLDTPTWIAVLKSLEVGAYSQNSAEGEAATYRASGIDADVLRSDDYASLRSGYWVVYAGFWDRVGDADAWCSGRGYSRAACYGRFLQDHPGEAYPGRCGEYGRVQVSGIASGDSLDVYGHPNTSWGGIYATLPANADGILVAGEGLRSGSIDWVPVVAGDIIGWVDGAFLEPDPSCLLPLGTASLQTCNAVAEAGIQMAQAVLDALAGMTADDIMGVTPDPIAALQNYAGELAARADELGCGTELRAAVRAAGTSFTATGSLARLVRELIGIDGIFSG